MDRSDWERTYEECFPRVFRALVAIGARPEDAEDALHDAFERGLNGREEIARPEGWLFVVGSRRWRRQRLRTAIFSPLSLLPRSAPAFEPDHSELLEELRGLPLRQRQVIAARYLLGLSQAETASTLGIARGTVSAHTSQGLARLKSRLEVR